MFMIANKIVIFKIFKKYFQYLCQIIDSIEFDITKLIYNKQFSTLSTCMFQTLFIFIKLYYQFLSF